MALVTALRSRWGGVMLRGVLALLVGVFALINPASAALSLALLFAIFVIVEGALVASAGWGAQPREWVLVVMGVLGVVFGLIAAMNPGLFALTLMTWMGVWSLARGVLEIVTAIRLRKELTGEGWLMLGGVISIAFGALLIAKPLAGVVAHGVLFGIYALAAGFVLVTLAFRLKRLPKA